MQKNLIHNFLQKVLTKKEKGSIIVNVGSRMIQRNKRQCWNWQTGTFEGRVLYDVWVQVPFAAPKNYDRPPANAGGLL